MLPVPSAIDPSCSHAVSQGLAEPAGSVIERVQWDARARACSKVGSRVLPCLGWRLGGGSFECDVTASEDCVLIASCLAILRAQQWPCPVDRLSIVRGPIGPDI